MGVVIVVGDLENAMTEEIYGARYCGGGGYVGLFEDVGVR